MEPTYKVSFDGQVLQIGFGAPSDNDRKVVDALAGCAAIKDEVIGTGLDVLRVNGAASLPVAMTIAHAFAHLVPAIACFDPKIDGGSYVISISHSPKYKVGDVIK